MTNEMIRSQLRAYAEELSREGGQLFRVRSYRAAAFEIGRMVRPLAEVFATAGRAGLEALPGIGKSLAYTIEGLLNTGDFRVLREQESPRNSLLSLPGVGVRLAEQLRDRLGITTMEQFREAARAGRLGELFLAKKRLTGILAAIDARLQEQEAPRPPEDEPSLADLLAVDEKVRAHPDRVVVTQREGWTIRATFASTALAHRLGKTNDWVAITFERGDRIGQRTVVTETRGDLFGMRVVRGRESECAHHHRAPAAA
jgi:hypothetical protein